MLVHYPARRLSCHRRTGEHCDKPVWTSKLGHYLPETRSTNSVEGLCKINKGGFRDPVLFLAILLELSSCKDHVHCASTSAEATLTLREMSLSEVFYEAVEEDSGQDLASSGQQRYTPVIVTGLAVTFVCKGVQWRHP